MTCSDDTLAVSHIRVSCIEKSGQKLLSWRDRLMSVIVKLSPGPIVLLYQVWVTYELYCLSSPTSRMNPVSWRTTQLRAAACSTIRYGAVVRKLPFRLYARMRTWRSHVPRKRTGSRPSARG